MNDSTLMIECPKCGKKIAYDRANPFRPFCSEKCRLIDLGAWLEEEYRVPVEESEDPLGLAPEGEPE